MPIDTFLRTNLCPEITHNCTFILALHSLQSSTFSYKLLYQSWSIPFYSPTTNPYKIVKSFKVHQELFFCGSKHSNNCPSKDLGVNLIIFTFPPFTITIISGKRNGKLSHPLFKYKWHYHWKVHEWFFLFNFVFFFFFYRKQIVIYYLHSCWWEANFLFKIIIATTKILTPGTLNITCYKLLESKINNIQLLN